MTAIAPLEPHEISGSDEGSGSLALADPIPVALHLRPPQRRGIEERFAQTDPPRGWDLTRFPRIARIVKSRHFQFMLILPNQIIFWLVIFLGLLGTVVPGLNFGTAITWYIWFCLVFVMMVVVGRAWCAMCPFGGFAEWIQRRSFWKRTQKALSLGRKLPEPVARYGLLLSVATFIGLTWIEEFFNIAGPGNPWDTSYMVLGIVVSALAFFLIFERRTFCRYLCPLSALIGTVGAMGSAAGFRTRDREVCLACPTKDCMRGGEEGYGCPWYTWPGSADSNLTCGLCSECYKACPSDNVGFFVQRPLTSVVSPKRRRADVAWAVAFLWGLVIFQQVNATNGYTTLDNWLGNATGIHYPNPIDYLGIIALVAAAFAGLAWLISRAFGARRAFASLATAEAGEPAPSSAARGRSFVDATSRFRSFFLPIAYGAIPVVGADYFARQLPKFFKHAPRIVPSVGAWFGLGGGVHSSLYGFRILSNPNIVIAQVVVIGLGTLASLWATWKITGRDLVQVSDHAMGARLASLGVVLACGVAAGFLYVIMHAAS
jgi:NosR/NirI family nitrous oxide reductase transcriptional regulator